MSLIDTGSPSQSSLDAASPGDGPVPADSGLTSVTDSGHFLDIGIDADAGQLDALPVDATDATSTPTPDSGIEMPDAESYTDGGFLADSGTHTSSCVPQAANFGIGTAYGDATSCLSMGGPHYGYTRYLATGQAWGDFDGDDWLDLYITNQTGPNLLYRNLRDGRFELVATSSVVALTQHISGGAIFADYDNDGDQDLYVLNHGANVLFRNDPSGFVDVTRTASIGDTGKGITASWGDYDQDGFLDLFVSNWLCDDCVSPPSPEGSRDRLYHNNGDGTFTDVTDLLGYDVTLGATFSAVWMDIDNDNDLDLYTANDDGILGSHLDRNVLWRNDGPGCGGWCFTETASAAGAAISLSGMGLAVGDYDNDGDLDIFCTNRGPPVLLQNDGTGSFTEMATAANVADDSQSWGALFYDYNNDSRLDLYVAIGWDNWGIDDNLFYENTGSGVFQNVNRVRRVSHPGVSFGAAYADYDKDGFLDLIVGNFRSNYALYRHLGQVGISNNWIRYRLVGDGRINRDAVGSRVYIDLDNGQTLMQEVKSGSSLGAGNDLALHFGLGQATIQDVQVRWSNGVRERLTIPSPNQEIRYQYR